MRDNFFLGSIMVDIGILSNNMKSPYSKYYILGRSVYSYTLQ